MGYLILQHLILKEHFSNDLTLATDNIDETLNSPLQLTESTNTGTL